MPIYEYQCLKCGEKFALRRNLNDTDSEIECHKCGTKEPKRLLSSFSTSTSYCGGESKSFSGGG